LYSDVKVVGLAKYSSDSKHCILFDAYAGQTFHKRNWIIISIKWIERGRNNVHATGEAISQTIHKYSCIGYLRTRMMDLNLRPDTNLYTGLRSIDKGNAVFMLKCNQVLHVASVLKRDLQFGT
jgi:hypothetical protein